ncbi:hypothetical protein K458DRAFT_414891 [Lentithecium fluviatile CBS 122367]|uniref:Mtf2-like C-terminal domain-containing protein n=1 Tax=Lentithecium fluviatile CBS 122367 TaxID=1168545 RepID=A0A6G1JB78_9PLEO|nr:hypothetical protein K458DRAFT_414891 [Lentithecium fluviatile CBS 122367]
MSLCSRSIRALSCSRLPPPKTLTPFLYQTATIQLSRGAIQPVPRRNVSSHSRYQHDVPFEDEFESQIDDDAAPTRPTTITGSERAAFEKLYKTFKPTTPPQTKPEHDIDQIVDEHYEEEEMNDAPAASLDSIFDAVLAGRPPPDASGKHKRKRKHDDLASLAEEILRPEMDKAKKKERTEKVTKAAKIKGLQTEERERVRALLKAAQTDRELWEVLEKEVFGVMRGMNLDGPAIEQKQDGKQPKGTDHTTSIGQESDEPSRFPTSPVKTPFKPLKPKRDLGRHDPRILFTNFPLHLVFAANTLCKNFPSSPLPLVIIPALKSLGRSSYALGATTSLYKVMIRAAWLQHHSYSQICNLLQDMDNGGIEPDNGVLRLLDGVLDEYRLGICGRMGRAVQVVWNLELFDEGAKQLKAWRDVIAKRLGVWGDKRAERGQIVRMLPEGSFARAGALGPRDELVIKESDVGKEEEIAAPHGDTSLVEGGNEYDAEAEVGGVGSSESALVEDVREESEAQVAR